MRWIGAAMIVAGCGGCGLMMARNYRKEERYMRQLQRSLDRMISELSCHMTPLPQLLRQGADSAGGELSRLLLELAEELELQLAPDAGCCMSVVLGKHNSIPDKTADILRALGRSLGSYDLMGQLRELEALHAECDRILRELSENRENRIRSYQTLGLCAGAALAILLL